LYGYVSELLFLPLANSERFLKNLDALDYDRELPRVSVRLWDEAGQLNYLEQGRARTDVCYGVIGI